MLFRSAKAHDVFHSSAVVPASVEDDNFPGGGKVPHVTLHVHLALFAVGWSGQRHETENARADPFRDRTFPVKKSVPVLQPMTYFLAFGGKSLKDFVTSSLTTLSKLRNALSGSRNVLLYVVSQMVFLDSSVI